MRRPLLWVAAAALVAVSCSAQDAIGLPDCEGDGPQVIMAQSVPGAEQIPCLRGLPDGWSLSDADVTESGSRFELDSDRAGRDAAVLTLTGSCDVTDAVLVGSAGGEIERYENVLAVDPSFRSERSYVFAGGCVQWRFDFDRDVSATLTVELDDRLEFLSRADFEQQLRDEFLEDVEL